MKHRPLKQLCGLLASAAIALVLIGCNGKSGATGANGANGPAGPAGPAGPGTPGGSGASGVVNVGSNAITNTTAIEAQAAAWKDLQPTVTVTGITIASAPVVTFKVADMFGKPVVGLGNTAKKSNAPVASLTNLAFSMAKLVPAANGSPSKWVSYMVTTVPTTTSAATATRPSTDNSGTLVDNGDGTYKYTFYRDVTKIKAQVDAMTLSGNNRKEDLGDLTYEPNLTHRLTIQLSGYAPGTGNSPVSYVINNTPTGAASSIAGVPMAHPYDAIYDFIPATGQPVTSANAQREIAANANCESCHSVLGGIPGLSEEAASAGFHEGSRNNVQYCVVCHTQQRAYGQPEATFATNGAVKDFSGSTYVVDGRSMGDLTILIHKAHMGKSLVNKDYNYANVLFNEVGYPQDIRNCNKCHDGGNAGSSATSVKTAQGNNWMAVPSAKACGSCHDGINFKTGTGVTLQDAMAGKTTSAFAHPVGAQPDDSLCTLCHKPQSIDLYHLPVTPPSPGSSLASATGTPYTNAAWIASDPARLPAGAIVVTHDVKQIKLNATRNPQMVFRMLQNGARKDLTAFDTATPNAQTGQKEIWDNYMGAPGVYLVWSVPQDGIDAPTDFNASASLYLKDVWRGAAAGSLTGPDADGYYTVTFTGIQIPMTAKMLSGGLGHTYALFGGFPPTPPLAQTNLPSYPVTATAIPGRTGFLGGLIVVTPNKQTVATGFQARRTIVDNAKCNACHQKLGPFAEEAFHAGQNNDATTCSWCHVPNKTSSGWSADAESFVHAIHASAKRTVPYNWHAKSATESYAEVTYPGVLNRCETCHVPGSYDFSATQNANEAGQRLYRTVGQGTYAPSYMLSPYVGTGVDYGAGPAYNAGAGTMTPAANTTLVVSPTVAACFACHDSNDAMWHYKINGGAVYGPRSAALATGETCLVCHGPGRTAAIKEAHAKP